MQTFGRSDPIKTASVPLIGQMERGEVPKVKPFAKEQREYKYKAFYVLKDVLKQCGVTVGCNGCKYMALNQGGKKQIPNEASKPATA